MGAGGREHALARGFVQSADVVVTPGNAGMAARSGEGHVISVTQAPPEDIHADLFVIGPEAPLVDGLADRLRARGVPVVGPGAAGARLEGSKAFMKEVLAQAGVPTARYAAFDKPEEALGFLRTLPGPWVVKTDGLAAGKGVCVATSLDEAETDVLAKLSGRAFGDAGRRVVIEEGLSGSECSLLALCDAKRVVPLVPSQDYKRAEAGDRGPNTGGMGAFSPVPAVDDALADRLVCEAVEPVVAVLQKRGIDYRGVLYAGLMLTADGPKVLEYNVRLGDPEAQVVLARLAGDWIALFMAVAQGRLSSLGDAGHRPPSSSEAAVCVVLSAEGYPGTPRRGDVISGLGPDGQLADPIPGVTVLHAGTRRDDPDGPFLTDGGRVLGVTALAPSLADARERAYRGARSVHWPGVQLRPDIAAGLDGAGTAGHEQATSTAGSPGAAR